MLNTDWKKVWNVFLQALKDFFGIIHSPSTVMAEQGGFMISGLLNGLKEKFTEVTDWLSELPQKFKDFFQTAKEKITEVFSNIGTWFKDKFDGAYENVKNAFSNAKTFFSDIWEGIKNTFGNITGWFKDKFSAAWQAVKDVFSEGGQIFEDIKGGILSSLKSVINNLITGINKVIRIPFNGINSALDKIRNVKILGVHPFSWLPTIGVPQIPYLAKGAVIPPNAPFMAVMGDQKSGRNLETPERLLRQIIHDEMSNQNQSGNSGNIVYKFTGQINRRTLFEEMITEAQLVMSQSGRNPFEMA